VTNIHTFASGIMNVIVMYRSVFLYKVSSVAGAIAGRVGLSHYAGKSGIANFKMIYFYIGTKVSY
jgi:hypothetical protein